jgi:hypothetical protein
MSIHVVFKWLKIYVLKNRWHGLVINSSLRYAMTDMTWWCTTQYRNFTLCILLLQLLRVSWKPDWVFFFFFNTALADWTHFEAKWPCP